MGLPLGVIHDGIAQAEWGLSGISVTFPSISGLGLISFGFLWSQGDWAQCYNPVVTNWSLCAGYSTGWSLIATPSTVWTAC